MLCRKITPRQESRLGPLYKYGNDLGPVHRSIRPVEMLPHVRKLYKIEHVTESQRVQYSCVLTQALPYKYSICKQQNFAISAIICHSTSSSDELGQSVAI